MAIKIIKAGICSSIQDLGRTGYRSMGIGSGGAMDFFAASVANYLAGNDTGDAVIEMHFPAAEILFRHNTLISIAGANFDPYLGDEAVKMYQPIFVKKDAVLSFKKNISGARVYVAIHGGMQVEKWLGSYSTNTKVKAGGCKGRLLDKEDVIGLNKPAAAIGKKRMAVSPAVIEKFYGDQNYIRCIAGPEWNLMGAVAENIFLQSSFAITNQSDRMGYRMVGEPVALRKPTSLVSSPVSFGTIQLLPNGQFIILMADHQTTGGYPRVAGVITADLPKLAQLPVSSTVNFKMVSLTEAEEILISTNQTLTEVKKGCQQFYAAH